MSESLETRTRELADIKLPALAHNKRRLESVYDRPATSHADLARIFGDDPGLAAALLQELGRSPRAAQLSVASPARVIGLLGLEAVRKLVQATPTLEGRYRGTALEGLRDCYSRALHASRFARCLAGRRAQTDADEEAVAALLQGLGEMAMWARRPGTMQQLAQQLRQPEDLETVAFRQLGASLGGIGERLAREWLLPQRIQLVQRFANAHEPEVQLPLLAAAIAWHGTLDWQSRQTDELLELAAEFIHLDPDGVRANIHRETAEAARILHALGLPHTADRLLLPPGAAPTAPPGRTASAPAAAARPLPRPQDSGSTAAAARPQPRPTATRPDAPRAGSRPKARPARPATAPSPLQRELAGIMKEMRDELGLQRVMLAMLTPDKQQIRARYVLENGDSELSGFTVPAGQKNLFSLLLIKPHALWINSGNQLKYLPYIPAQAAGLVSTTGFFTASLVARNRPIGVFYADAADDPGGLSEEGFRRFRKLCSRASSLIDGMKR